MANADIQAETMEQLEQHRRLVQENQGYADKEQQTRQLLIDPFIRNVLGYDFAKATDILTAADVTHGSSVKKEADYAIKMPVNGEPIDFLLVEAKSVKHPLGEEEIGQLRDYVSGSPSARFGLLTDGVDYLWFKCPPKMRTMEDSPFLKHCALDEPSPETSEWLAAVSKGSSDLDGLERLALRVSLEDGILEWLRVTFANPSLKEADTLNRVANLKVAKGELTLVQEAAKSVWSRLQPKCPPPRTPRPPRPTSSHIDLEIALEPQLVLGDGEVLTPDKLPRAWRIGNEQWRRTNDASDLVAIVLSELLACDIRRKDEKLLARDLNLDSFDSPPEEKGFRVVVGFSSVYCNTSVSNLEKRKLLERIAQKVQIDPSVGHPVTQGKTIECWLPTGGSRAKRKTV